MRLHVEHHPRYDLLFPGGDCRGLVRLSRAEPGRISNEKVNLNWTGDGPKVLWKAETNTGFSSLAVAGGKVFTQVKRNLHGSTREICVALDATTGKELWMADLAVGKGYSGGGDGDGPRSTPTISEGLVYTFTPDLVLHCHDAETGKTAMDQNLIKEHAGHNIQWNSAASPVIDGELVFVAGGGPVSRS